MSMKWFLRIALILAVLLLGALGWQWLAADPGVLQLRIRGYVIETTVIVAVAALLLGLAALWLVVWLLRAPLQWLAGRRRRRARHAFAQAELRLREGQWSKAEKLFARAAADPDFRVPALLEAAQAAATRGDANQARDYLDRLDDDAEGRRLVQLERAREALADDRPDETLAVLSTLDPTPPSAVLLRVEALRALHRAEDALAELPNLHRAQLLDGLHYAKLELAVVLQALDEARDRDALARIWAILPKGLKRAPDVSVAYVERAHVLGADDPAALIEQHLRQDWSDDLARLYGRLEQPAPSLRFKIAEQWLAMHPDSAALNVSLGRLSLQQGLDQQAEGHLARALELANEPDAWELMADIHVRQQQPERARIALMNALRARRREAPLPVPVPVGSARGDNLGLFAVAEERSEHGVPRLPGASPR